MILCCCEGAFVGLGEEGGEREKEAPSRDTMPRYINEPVRFNRHHHIRPKSLCLASPASLPILSVTNVRRGEVEMGLRSRGAGIHMVHSNEAE
jgi:hypothetical protein